MKTAIFALLASGLAVLALAPPTGAQAQYSDCVTLSGGIIACGEVSDGICGVGSGSGQATGFVDWTLKVATNHGNAYDYASGPAAVLEATAPCWTDTCTTVYLYANDVLVVSSMRICMNI